MRIVNSSHDVDTSGRSKFDFQIKPDYCLYSKDEAVITDVSQAEIIGEIKLYECDDPFVHPPVMKDGKRSFWNFENALTSFDTTGQLAIYAAAQLGTQYCTCVYSFFLVRDKARLIRWDRSGAIVTESFPYDEEPHLAEFFHRYSEASPELRGVDTTMERLTEENVGEARFFLGKHLGPDRPLLKVSILTEDERLRQYIIGVPDAAPHPPIGRGTRGGVAYDIEGKRLVYLKDTWRIARDDIEREGDIC